MSYSIFDFDFPHGVHALLFHDPEHRIGSRHVKSIVWGGLDGIITTFSVVAAAVGGNLDRNVVLLMGFANLVSDGLSMGFGDYLSSKAENDYIMQERRRELWEMENFPEAEKVEMINLYHERGIEDDDAKQLVNIMAKYPSFFVDIMMVEELGLITPEGENPAIDGLVTFVSFAIFGYDQNKTKSCGGPFSIFIKEVLLITLFLILIISCRFIPLLSYIGNFKADFNVNFTLACVLTGFTLLALGFAKAHFTKQNRLVSSVLMLFNGGVAAVAAFLIGWGISEAI